MISTLARVNGATDDPTVRLPLRRSVGAHSTRRVGDADTIDKHSRPACGRFRAEIGEYVFRLITSILLVIAPPVVAQPCSTDLIESVASGKRAYETLDQEGQACIRWFIATQRSGRCSSGPKYCRAICESAEKLRAAADDLASCARRAGPQDDCSRTYREVRDAFDDHERNVADRGNDCS